MMEREAVRLHHIATDDQIVDILTKSLPKGKFLVFKEQLGGWSWMMNLGCAISLPCVSKWIPIKIGN